MLTLSKKKLICLLLKSFLFNYVFKDLKYILLKCLYNIQTSKYSLNIVFLPKRIKKFSVVRSPTTSKLSKEQFEFVNYKVCVFIDVYTDLWFFFYKDFFLKLQLLSFSYIRLISIKKWQ